MLKYSNTHRRDPNVGKYALKCALTLIGVLAVGFILFNYGLLICQGISSVIEVVCSAVATGFVATSKFFNPVFVAVGQYMLWACLLLCLWSLCVYCKIDANCEESKNQWRIIGLGFNTLLFIYTILYVIYLNYNEDPFSKYGFLYVFLSLYVMMSTVCFIVTEEKQ